MNGAPAFGPDLRSHVLQQLATAIETHRATLHPEDVEMAPMELRSWMAACDTRWDRQTLEHGARRAVNALRSAAGGCMGDDFIAMRTPHAVYAVAALHARFGIDLSHELAAALAHGATA